MKSICKCGARCDELSSYFGIPLHRNGQEYRVCRLWSGHDDPWYRLELDQMRLWGVSI